MLCCFFHVYKLGRKNTRVSFVTIASIVMMWNLWVIKTNILRDNHMTHEAKKPQNKLSLKQKAKLESIARIKALMKETGRHYKGRKIKLQEFFQNRIDNFKQVCESFKDPKTGNRTKVGMFSLEARKKLVVCRTAKHASTTLANLLIKMTANQQDVNGTQVAFQKVESKIFTPAEKRSVVRSLETPGHEFLSLVVCRNPVEKLLSVYKVMLDPKAVDPEDFPSRREFVKPRSWSEFLTRVAAAQEENYLGLLRPLHRGCDPCTYHYDVPVMMETFDRDIRAVLESSSLGHLAPSHYNIHGNNTLTNKVLDIDRLFGGVDPQVVVNITHRYQKDFLLCGYHDSLASLQKLTREN